MLVHNAGMEHKDRRLFLASLAALGHAVFSKSAMAAIGELQMEDALSSRNASRAKRPRTDYIILHTTEADDSSSLNSVQRFGSCNYLVQTDGQVLRIIDRDKIANHAGRSMWNGAGNLSTRSIGIEIVGTYKASPREAQLVALKELLDQLKRRYNVVDKNVLTHSQVAYSFRSREGLVRGRRKDAVKFADPVVRAHIGLNDRWTYDPDERAGRVSFQELAEGRWLHDNLYRPGPSVVSASIATSARLALKPTVTALVPEAVETASDETEETGDPETFEGFLEVGVNGDSVDELAGREALSRSTIYILPDGRIRPGDRLRGSALLAHPPVGLKILVGYVIGGEVTRRMHAIDIAGAAWNYPSTFYRLPDLSLRQGDKIKESAIPPGTVVLYRH